jgi:hypothetical protein
MFCWAVLFRSCGSARAEAIQPRALLAGIVTVMCDTQKFSKAIECWLQSNVNDVVRLIVRLLWGTKVGCCAGGADAFVTHLVSWHRPFGVGPLSPWQSDSVDCDDEGGSRR